MTPTLYQMFQDAGIPTDSHETDLYVPDEPRSHEVISAWRESQKAAKGGCTQLWWTRFRSEIDGKIWLDIPFMFEPAWDRRRGRA